MKIQLTVNGRAVSRDVTPDRLLVQLLREDLALTGTHVGCDTAQCGACTVHLDGRAVKACNLLAVQADGTGITTIEGLAAAGGALHPMQARGVEQTLRLLLAGVVVGVVLNALTGLATLWAPDILRAMQAFLLGNTGLLGWSSVSVMAASGALALIIGLLASPALDALTLGEATAASLGVRMPLVRLLLIFAFALATGAAVAQTGIVAFVGLVAPHLVRAACPTLHGRLILLSAAAGGALLLAADVLARALVRPQELPVGLVTALLGGVYLLVLMHRRGTPKR